MEYVKNDSSGTDDDLPNPGIIRASKGLACSGIMAIASGPMSSDKDLRDMEFQVHCIEIEAYSAVLRAFIAQSNDLSWGKEELISELRKELRVSDVEHREILGKVHSDDSIKFLRESLKNAEAQLAAMNPPPLGPNSMGHVPCKKLKQGHMTISASPQYLTYAQPSSTAVQLPAKHARDDQLGRKGTLFSPQSNGQALGPVNPNVQPNKVKARGSLIVQASKKGFVHSGVDILKPGSDIIEILATDKLIHEVERVCGGENPEPALVQRAKLILKDHERALLEAIGKLADVSDGDDSPDRIQYMIQEPQSRAHVFPNNRSRSHCK